MKTSHTTSGTGGAALRGALIVGVAVALSGCGMFGWIGSRFSSDKNDAAPAAAAPAPAAAAAPKAQPTLGAADPTDPVPRDEPLHPSANKWYGANGKLYRPITDDREFKERGKASVIGADQEGKPTASGESFTPAGLTGAHSRLPIPSYARVTDLRTGRSAIVRINDRGAYDRDEAIAISAAVARRIGHTDSDEVEVERITPAEIAAMPATRAAAAPAAPALAALPPPVAVSTPQSALPRAAEPTPLAPQPVAVAQAPVAPAMPATQEAPPVPPVQPAPPATSVTQPAMVVPRAAPAGTPPTRAAKQTAATGRWSVQVATFATSTMAESTRARVAQQLAQSAPNLASEPRVARLGNRSYVLLGDFADRESAEALAGRLRAVLRQDVVVDRH